MSHGSMSPILARDLRVPMLTTRIKGALGVACPRCGASPGHRCKPLARSANSLAGAPRRQPHRERKAAAK